MTSGVSQLSAVRRVLFNVMHDLEGDQPLLLKFSDDARLGEGVRSRCA